MLPIITTLSFEPNLLNINHNFHLFIISSSEKVFVKVYTHFMALGVRSVLKFPSEVLWYDQRRVDDNRVALLSDFSKGEQKNQTRIARGPLWLCLFGLIMKFF